MKPSLGNSEITPETTYLNRRFLMKASLYAGTALTTAGLFRAFAPRREMINTGATLATVADDTVFPKLGPEEPPNSFTDISTYNNYYEFSTSKARVAEAAKNFRTDPWRLEIGGLVKNPATFDLGSLLKFPQIERVYRMRCVEGWSMVIPWIGFPLRNLLLRADPAPGAKYAAFESYHDMEQMPDSGSAGIDLPYVEGLRLDEAMHPLTLLATGLYGKTLPNQNGAPIRLVVPWKYGFKGIKSIVRITLTDRQPQTTWSLANPDEYGFYSNVNPNVPHPRWSQASEQRIGETFRRPTLMFNGYGEQVASLYQGMDLKMNF
ncbi:MAG: protein-methionine-sulfoxide reductase catalytic subunit MsrP [Verrucomicrobiaceae bacterium]|nr:MAG: protein-methionine-sulfoxide reductase catalytic subunit MsrP [Verrucomicrobiaceae bacterium]